MRTPAGSAPTALAARAIAGGLPTRTGPAEPADEDAGSATAAATPQRHAHRNTVRDPHRTRARDSSDRTIGSVSVSAKYDPCVILAVRALHRGAVGEGLRAVCPVVLGRYLDARSQPGKGVSPRHARRLVSRDAGALGGSGCVDVWLVENGPRLVAGVLDVTTGFARNLLRDGVVV